MSESKMRKPRRPTQSQYDKAVADVAIRFVPEILECQKCGWPHVDGYCCSYCGDADPTSPAMGKEAGK